MKKSVVKKTLTVSALAAVLGLSAQTHADSLLAPLIISDIGNGFETVLSLKVKGTGAVNHNWANFGANASHLTDLHYTWLRKGSNLGHLFTLGRGCVHENNTGKVSPYDMVFQSINPALQGLAVNAADRTSNPVVVGAGNGINRPAAPFYGMAVLDDVANLNPAFTTGVGGGSVGEGEMSGFAYVMHLPTGLMFDYKLLNNHRSQASGDFAAGFVSKTSVDLSWNPLNRDLTAWLGVATGMNMTIGDWAGRITLSQNTLTINGQTQLSPTLPFGAAGGGGVYNNDEVVESGDSSLAITCMGMFTRGDILNTTQAANTANGGWTRKSIAPSNGATGGLIYKAEAKIIPSLLAGSLVTTFQPETTGHLSSGPGGAHPNRPQ